MKPWDFRFGRVRISFDTGLIKNQWVLKLTYGPGAGYIGGWTAYFARNTEKLVDGYGRIMKAFRCGVTHNANIIPLCHH